jgi:DNA-binding response OmpR family regulator
MKFAKDRALVVEDSSTIAAIVKHYLELEGFDVLVAADGIAGLETARREQPDLIVTDMNLPGMDGLDMVRALRADKTVQHMSIFMLTSDASAETERRAREIGVDDYLVKPVPPKHLAARARAVMDRGEKSRQWVN